MLSRLEDRTVPSTITWDGGPTGTGTQWLDPVNWVGDVLPGPNDDAVIAAAGTGQPTTLVLGGSATVRSANVSRTVQVTAGVLTIGNGISTFTDLELNGGTLTPQNGAQITGSQIQVQFPGVLEIPANVAMTITATTIDGAISNEGTLTGSFEQYGSVTNAAGAVFVAHGVQLLTGNVSNAGTIIIDGGLKVGRYLGPPYLVYYLGQIDNSAGGVINAHGEVWGNFTNAGVINIDSGLGWTGVSWRVGGGVSGGDSLNSGIINVSGGDLFMTATDERSNFIRFNNTGTLNVSAARTFTNTGRLYNYSHVGTVGTLQGGTFNLAGTMSFSGDFGQFQDGVRITSLASNLTLDGPQSAIVDYHGLVPDPIQLKEIKSSGALSLRNGRNLSTFATPSVFTNSGVLAVGAGCTLTSVEPLVTSGLVTGAGALTANVYGGRISPGDNGGVGTLTATSIWGNSTNTIFAFDITGTIAGTQYDQIRVTGALLSQSRLKVFLGYEPQPGDTYKIIDRDNALGLSTDAFAGLQEGASFVINGHRLRASYLGGDGNDVTLTVVAPDAPAPTVTGVDVAEGSSQRSRISQIRVSFDQVVTFNAGPSTSFRLDKIVGGVPNGSVQIFVTPGTVGDHTEAVVSFLSDTTSGSLNDGRYRLTVIAQNIFGGGVPMAHDDVTDFHRLFGDANGDSRVDVADYGLFSVSYGKHVGDPGYLAYFDYNGDGLVDAADYGQFSLRYLSRLP